MHPYQELSPSCVPSPLTVVTTPGRRWCHSIVAIPSFLLSFLPPSLPCHSCGKLRLREFTPLSQGHTAGKWQSHDLKLDLWDPCSFFALMIPFFSLKHLKSAFLNSRAKYLTMSSLMLSQALS